MDRQPNEKIEIPDKLYFRIGQVSKLTGLPAHVLRFWENEFPKLNPRRTDAGQRLYRRNDVKLILTVKHLLYEKKFTIQGARNHLSRKKKSGRTETDLAKKISEIRSELLQLRKLLS